MTPTILLTGFEPFGGESVNPSAEVIAALSGRGDTTTVLLPTTFAGAFDAARDAVGGDWPALVIALGQAAGRSAITVERVAINREQTTSTPDNAGDHPLEGRPVEVGGPDGLAVTIDVDAAVNAVRRAGVPAADSLSAGTHCCNAVLYRLLRATDPSRTKVGFVHLPALPEQRLDGTDPTMALDLQVQGVAALLDELGAATAR